LATPTAPVVARVLPTGALRARACCCAGASILEVRLLSADTFGRLDNIAGELGVAAQRLVRGEPEAQQKARVVQELGAERTIAIGNGANDVGMLEEAALGIAVLGPAAWLYQHYWRQMCWWLPPTCCSTHGGLSRRCVARLRRNVSAWSGRRMSRPAPARVRFSTARIWPDNLVES
jgi:hypothetical protein